MHDSSSVPSIREFRDVVFEDVGFEHNIFEPQQLKLIWVRGFEISVMNPTS